MTLIINSWSGRLGNNVLQIIRAIHYATLKNHSIIKFGKHFALNSREIIIENNNENNSTIKDSFFNLKIFNIKDPSPYLMKKYFQDYIFECFFIDLKEDSNRLNNTLYIHIRSGDCFKNPHAYYVPPPLSYYSKIIEENKWDRIYIVYEDDKNPCVNLLKNKNYNNIEFISGSLQNDLNILSQCQNLVIGFGTFGLLVYFLSKNIKNLYLPDYVYGEMPKGDWGLNLNIVNMPGYIKCGEWKLTENNIKKIINYINDKSLNYCSFKNNI